jgi:hypothetical protein
MPLPRINFGAIYYAGQVYVVGGWKNEFVQKCDSYDIQNNKWASLPDI